MSSISTTNTTTKFAKKQVTLLPTPVSLFPPMITSWAVALPPSSAQDLKPSAAHSPPTNRVRRSVSVRPRMAAVMPATTPTTPATAATMPLPSYQVSGAGAVPRHAASAGSSIGAFFGVLAAVLVLTVLSCVFGRVCAAQAEGPDESYDCTRLPRWRRRPVPAAEAKQQPPADGPPPPLPPPEP